MKKELNFQDTFLSRARKGRSPVTVFLVNGFQMRGIVEGFDVFTVVMSCDGRQNLIYKHAISTIMPLQPIDLREEDAEG